MGGALVNCPKQSATGWDDLLSLVTREEVLRYYLRRLWRAESAAEVPPLLLVTVCQVHEIGSGYLADAGAGGSRCAHALVDLINRLVATRGRLEFGSTILRQRAPLTTDEALRATFQHMGGMEIDSVSRPAAPRVDHAACSVRLASSLRSGIFPSDPEVMLDAAKDYGTVVVWVAPLAGKPRVDLIDVLEWMGQGGELTFSSLCTPAPPRLGLADDLSVPMLRILVSAPGEGDERPPAAYRGQRRRSAEALVRRGLLGRYEAWQYRRTTRGDEAVRRLEDQRHVPGRPMIGPRILDAWSNFQRQHGIEPELFCKTDRTK